MRLTAKLLGCPDAASNQSLCVCTLTKLMTFHERKSRTRSSKEHWLLPSAEVPWKAVH